MENCRSGGHREQSEFKQKFMQPLADGCFEQPFEQQEERDEALDSIGCCFGARVTARSSDHHHHKDHHNEARYDLYD